MGSYDQGGVARKSSEHRTGDAGVRQLLTQRAVDTAWASSSPRPPPSHSAAAAPGPAPRTPARRASPLGPDRKRTGASTTTWIGTLAATLPAPSTSAGSHPYHRLGRCTSAQAPDGLGVDPQRVCQGAPAASDQRVPAPEHSDRGDDRGLAAPARPITPRRGTASPHRDVVGIGTVLCHGAPSARTADKPAARRERFRDCEVHVDGAPAGIRRIQTASRQRAPDHWPPPRGTPSRHGPHGPP